MGSKTSIISSNTPYGGLHILKQTCAESTFTTLKKQTSSSLKKKRVGRHRPTCFSSSFLRNEAHVFFLSPGSQILSFFWWRVSHVKRHTFTLLETPKILFKGNKNLVLNIFYFLQLVFHEASGYSTIQGVVFSMGCSFPLPWFLWVSFDATPSLRLCLVVLKEASKRTCAPLLVHWGLWGSKYLTQ